MLAFFWSGFLPRTTGMSQQSCFSHLLGIFNFSPKRTILQRVQPLLNGYFCQFFNWSNFPNNSCFLEPFLHRTTVMCQQSRFSHLLGIFTFSPKRTILQRLQPLLTGHFCQFSNWCHLSNIRCFLELFFAQNNCNVLVESFFACFGNF